MNVLKAFVRWFSATKNVVIQNLPGKGSRALNHSNHARKRDPLIHYICKEDPDSKNWNIQFTRPSFIKTPHSASELTLLLDKYDKILMVGVFSWSNYSRQVFQIIVDSESFFTTHRIAVAMYCIENPEYLSALCSPFYALVLRATNEPVMLLMGQNSPPRSHTGPIGVEQFKNWLLRE